MIKGVKRYMNEYYSKDLSMKTKRGMRESVLKGNCIGGIPLYGYKFVDKKIVIDEEKAEIIRYVFEEYAKGKPMSQINRELNAKGVRNQAGNPLSATSFQGNLRNKKYIGIFNYNGVDYYDVYPAIISENIFKKVQDRLKARAYAPSGGRGKVDYMLYGKAFCGICGNTMIGDSSNNSNGVRYDYYSCIKRKNYNVCTKKRVRKEELEIYVVEQTKRQVLIPKRIEQVANSVVASFNNNATNIKIGNMQKRIVKINRDIDKCFNIILDTDNLEISKRADTKAKALQQQKEDIEVTIARLKLSIESRYSKEQIISWLTMHSNGDVNDIDYRKKIIDIFIKAIFLYDEKVVIYYNVSNNDDKNVTYEDNSDFIDNLKDDNNVRVYKTVEPRIEDSSL